MYAFRMALKSIFLGSYLLIQLNFAVILLLIYYYKHTFPLSRSYIDIRTAP
jgi:hypothetical protein